MSEVVEVAPLPLPDAKPGVDPRLPLPTELGRRAPEPPMGTYGLGGHALSAGEFWIQNTELGWTEAQFGLGKGYSFGAGTVPALFYGLQVAKTFEVKETSLRVGGAAAWTPWDIEPWAALTFDVVVGARERCMALHTGLGLVEETPVAMAQVEVRMPLGRKVAFLANAGGMGVSSFGTNTLFGAGGVAFRFTMGWFSMDVGLQLVHIPFHSLAVLPIPSLAMRGGGDFVPNR